MQVGDERAVPPEARAGAAVDRGARRGRQVTGQRRARLRLEAGDARRSPPASTPPPRSAAASTPVDWRPIACSSSRPSLEDHVQQRQQQPGVGVGAYGHVLEQRGGLAAPRVDDDDAPAARR